MSAVAIRSDTSPAEGFDYSSVDKATASEARALAERVRSFERRVTTEVIQLGQALVTMKERIGHGRFGPWIAAEFGDKMRTAQRYMLAAEAFGAKSDTVSYLPPGTLYTLAAPQTPAPIRDAIVSEIEAGERIEPQVIRQRVRIATAEAQRAAKLANLSPEQRKRLAAKDKRQRTTAQQREAQWRAEMAAREAKSLREHDLAQQAVEIILARIPPEDLRQAFALIESNKDHLFTAMLRERVGATSSGTGALREHERLRVMVENRRRAETGEPRVRCSWQGDAEGELFALQPVVLE